MYMLKLYQAYKEDFKIAAALLLGLSAIGAIIIWYEQYGVEKFWSDVDSDRSGKYVNSVDADSSGTERAKSFDDGGELDAMKCMRGGWNVCDPKQQGKRRR